MHWFVGPPVFCRDDPAGKPANNSASNEQYNEFNQLHLFSFPSVIQLLCGQNINRPLNLRIGEQVILQLHQVIRQLIQLRLC